MNITNINAEYADANEMRSGFVAVVGKPNVGKSTLVNTIVGQKVAIISSKPQTTRHRILGVKNGPGYQIVFVDTPGIHKASHQLDKYMEKTYRSEIKDADFIIFMIDATHDLREEDKIALKILFGYKNSPNVPIFLAMNKIDKTDPKDLERRYEVLESMGNFQKGFKISALTGKGVNELVNFVAQALPPGPPYFPIGQVTDQNPGVQASEIVREKVLLKTRQEVPHCVFVHTEEFREGSTPDTLYIREIIYVERKSQKGIIIGKDGKKLKQIGTLAREELEVISGKKVYLDLWVKVKEDWRERKDLLRSWGYEV
ncbi:MAG: GTPase Era [Candidatus Eremiobacteraeota bacterium]|nr:GTPase Era [Candidatus Eremiobacteraeota bacterium]